MKEGDYKDLVEEFKKLQEQKEKTCPNCGYCPTCGRPHYPYQWNPPYWDRPYWYPTVTWSSDNTSEYKLR